MNRHLSAAALLAALVLPLVFTTALAETPCSGTALTGAVRDSAAALIPGAKLTLDSQILQASGPDGTFRFDCVTRGQHHLVVTAPEFASRVVAVSLPHAGALDLVLQPATVDTNIDISAADSDATLTSPTASGPTQTISGKQLNTLADDPDDLLRELQQMAAAAGGAPSSATIAVDGFDNGEGTGHLPPKSSIAYIKVNPDLFSAEYREPPFSGGRIEIYTKPGQSAFHGALFATNSSSWMNARDPFSNAPTAVGKQRYGFELTGPIRKQGSDFFTSLEHRTIDNDAVVNATDVDASTGQQYAILQTVPAAQHLWIGNAKVDWQLGAKNTFIASIDTYNNNTQNAGVGGTSLVSTGYANQRYDYNIHLTDVTVISPKIMHEARLGLEFDGYAYTPNDATDPSVSVAGAFTGGGSTLGAAYEHEIWISPIDDAIIQTKNHLIKVGIQPEFLHLDQHVPTNFNGTYTFGGDTLANGQTITGIQQYVNALNNAPNGTPTDFSNVTGNPEIEVLQFRDAVYYQDDWKLAERLHFAYGVRYATQNNPTFTSNVQPRVGLAWSPDKKSTWSLHAHAGMFAARSGAHNWAQFKFMDGVQRITNTVYNPTAYCPNGISASCNPLSGATVINTLRTIAPSYPNTYWSSENIGFSKTFPRGFTLSGDYYLAQVWHDSRSENINSPTHGSPTGPRPFGPNLNILQVQATGRGYGNIEFIGLSQQSFKRIQFFAGAVRVDVIDDTDDSTFFTPQTTGVNTGEYARRDNQGLWQIFGNATLNLPAKLVLSANYNGSGLQAYNVTTGFDNNGDGDFNDRPRYAAAGTPLCSTNPAATPCAYATQWGLLTNSGTGPTLSRDKGIMPWKFYLDTNLQRAFKLTKDPKSTHPQTLTANIRSSNVLNHENVTAVGTVLGSPDFGQAYQADNGRRIEGGVRYAF
jgi:hypothetical protein